MQLLLINIIMRGAKEIKNKKVSAMKKNLNALRKVGISHPPMLGPNVDLSILYSRLDSFRQKYITQNTKT